MWHNVSTENWFYAKWLMRQGRLPHLKRSYPVEALILCVNWPYHIPSYHIKWQSKLEFRGLGRGVGGSHFAMFCGFFPSHMLHLSVGKRLGKRAMNEIFCKAIGKATRGSSAVMLTLTVTPSDIEACRSEMWCSMSVQPNRTMKGGRGGNPRTQSGCSLRLNDGFAKITAQISL